MHFKVRVHSKLGSGRSAVRYVFVESIAKFMLVHPVPVSVSIENGPPHQGEIFKSRIDDPIPYLLYELEPGKDGLKNIYLLSYEIAPPDDANLTY